jgi:DNA polymerase elongation subunit (family B)
VSNLRKDASEDNVLNINEVYVKQNKNTLLPLAVKKILNLKDKYKKLVQQHPDDKKIATDYAAIKSIVNSFFGVFGSKYFNLYNLDIANSITFIIRDLMEYVSVALQNLGYEIIYIDTDGIIINVDHDISDIVNKLVKRWGKEKYAKDIEHLGFSYEHTYHKLFILGKCHLWGKYGDNKDKMRGIEAKRASSSKYEAKFQIALLEYILNEKDYTFCNNFLIQEISKFKSNSLIDISFPCKLPDRVYEKNYPIIQRAYDNAIKYIPGFKVNIGELFHYTYVSSESIDVIAFREEDVDYIVERFGINYDKLINRNITNKASAIFKAMNWNINLEKNQCALID